MVALGASHRGELFPMGSESGVRSPDRVRTSVARGDDVPVHRSPRSACNRDERQQHRRSQRGKVARRRHREFVLRTVSHNVQSLGQAERFELVISFMRKQSVDVYAMQETWLGG